MSDHIPVPVDLTALNVRKLAEALLDRGSEGLRSIDHEETCNRRVEPSLQQVAE